MLDVQVNRPPHCRLQQRLQKLVGAEFDGHQEVLANRLQFDWQTSKNRPKTWKQTEILWKHTIIGLCEEFVNEPEGALHQFYSSCYASDIRPHPRDFWDFRSGSVREKCLWSARVTSLSNEVQGDESMGQVFFGKKKKLPGIIKNKKKCEIFEQQSSFLKMCLLLHVPSNPTETVGNTNDLRIDPLVPLGMVGSDPKVATTCWESARWKMPPPRPHRMLQLNKNRTRHDKTTCFAELANLCHSQWIFVPFFCKGDPRFSSICFPLSLICKWPCPDLQD